MRFLSVVGRTDREGLERYLGFGARILAAACAPDEDTFAIIAVPDMHAAWLESRFFSGLIGCSTHRSVDAAMNSAIALCAALGNDGAHLGKHLHATVHRFIEGRRCSPDDSFYCNDGTTCDACHGQNPNFYGDEFLGSDQEIER